MRQRRATPFATRAPATTLSLPNEASSPSTSKPQPGLARIPHASTRTKARAWLVGRRRFRTADSNWQVSKAKCTSYRRVSRGLHSTSDEPVPWPRSTFSDWIAHLRIGMVRHPTWSIINSAWETSHPNPRRQTYGLQRSACQVFQLNTARGDCRR